MKNNDSSPSFEQQLEQIESIVEDLESGELSLDEMLNRYESGMRLIAACQQRLTNAELRVTEISAVLDTAQSDVIDDD